MAEGPKLTVNVILIRSKQISVYLETLNTSPFYLMEDLLRSINRPVSVESVAFSKVVYDFRYTLNLSVVILDSFLVILTLYNCSFCI